MRGGRGGGLLLLLPLNQRGGGCAAAASHFAAKDGAVIEFNVSVGGNLLRAVVAPHVHLFSFCIPLFCLWREAGGPEGGIVHSRPHRLCRAVGKRFEEKGPYTCGPHRIVIAREMERLCVTLRSIAVCLVAAAAGGGGSCRLEVGDGGAVGLCWDRGGGDFRVSFCVVCCHCRLVVACEFRCFASGHI